MSVHQPLQHTGDDERARERGADQDLGPVGRTARGTGRRGARPARGGRRGAGIGLTAEAGGSHPGSGDARGRARGRTLRGLAAPALGLVGLGALALGLALRGFGLLAGLLLLAGELLLALLRLADLLVGLGGLLLRTPGVGR